MSEPGRPCPYCGLTDHTGREHMQFVLAIQPPCTCARDSDGDRLRDDPTCPLHGSTSDDTSGGAE